VPVEEEYSLLFKLPKEVELKLIRIGF